jgi:hypothetical protein
MLRGWVFVLCLASHVQGDEIATSTSADRTALAVTVYSNGRALVREERDVTLPAGQTELRFVGVAEKIEAPTVRVNVLEGAAVSVLEQNYEYDLLSPQKLLEKFIGKTVTLVQQKTKDGSTLEEEVPAKLLSTNSGTVWEVGGRIVTNPPYNRLLFPTVPGNLMAHPTLVWLLDAKTPGKRKLEAAYLTSGIGWHADYVLALDASEDKAALQGWVTLDNQSGAGYENARLKLVAGDVHEVPRPQPAPVAQELYAAARSKAPMQEESFFEYHLYTLPRPTSVRENETKQVQLLNSSPFAIAKEYVLRGDSGLYRYSWQGRAGKAKVAVFLKFRNAEAQGLGLPLPAGTVRVYKQDRSGSPQFIGEDHVDHSPKDEDVKLELGNAFDLVAERTQTDFKKIGTNVNESTYEVRIRNHKDTPVVVRVIEPFGGDWTILEHSLPFQKTSATEAEFDMGVAPDKEAVLSYKVRTTF